jgi:hypothetical protein
MAGGKRLSPQLEPDVLEGQVVPLLVEQAHRRPRGAAALGRAAGVEDLEAILDLVQRKVAVTEDDGVGGWEAPAQTRQPALGGAGIMDDRDDPLTELNLELRRERAPQGRFVDVSVHGVNDRAERSHFLQGRGGEEIAGMDYGLGGGDRLDASLRQAPGSPGHMSVGEDGDHGN